MSKWSSERSDVIPENSGMNARFLSENRFPLFGKRAARLSAALILGFGLALAGCSRHENNDDDDHVRASTIVEPETNGIDSVPEEEPAVARNTWRAISESARSNTGNLRVSIEAARGGPVIFAFANGVTIRGQPIAQSPADARSGVAAQSYAALLQGDPRVQVYVYRVLDENVATNIRSGGLCGANVTRHLVASEFVDGGGRWTFRLAAFKGDRAPGMAGDDPELCGAFAYLAPAG
jgi:hypothetical protein